MRISDWSSDVCSSELSRCCPRRERALVLEAYGETVDDLLVGRFAVGAEHAVADGEVEVHQGDVELEVIAALEALQPLLHRPEGDFFDLIVVGLRHEAGRQSGRESCRERGCQYV